ncbi:MAG: glycoside hydrolase family 2 protein, partial [Ruminococcus sp.]
MTFTKECTGLLLSAEIIRNNEIRASNIINIDSENISFNMEVLFADLWDAEHPNLYTLNTVLCDENNNEIQKNTIKFGFREITYGGKKDTDNNKIYVNGKEIKLRGVCRHDVSRLYGRSVTKENIFNEIKTYKEHNINHIRTSHYPASDYMLEVCDELGIYVEQENAACFKGANGFDIYNPPADFLNSFKEMVEFSRNHPSVIIWSIANESGFEKSTGFRDCYDYIKQTDLTRPVIFSYPWTVKSKPLPYDIFSKHYEKVTSSLGKKDMPILHDEFAHIPCYNIDDLAYDNSSRVFWGESIKRGWDNIFNTSGALGCDIWAAIDDVIYLPENNMEKHQNHLKGECAGYGEWGCIFDTFKRLKPEAYLTKKAFTPIKIIDTSIYGDEIRFNIQNRFNHANLNEVFVTVKDNNSNILYQKKIRESIAPHCSGMVSVSPLNCTDNMRVEFAFDNVIVESVVLNKAYETLKIEPSAIKLDCAQNRITVSFDDEPVAAIKNMRLYTGINKFDVQISELTKINDNTYFADFGFGRAFLLTVNTVGNTLKFKIIPKNNLSSLYLIGELGVDIEPVCDFKSVSWIRSSLYNDYPENHIARDFGTAYKNGPTHNYDDTDIKNITWEQDMSAFAYYEKASRFNSLASNDFRTKRLRIGSY